MLNKDLWTNPATFATTLLLMFVDEYGTAPVNGEDPWDPETILEEINEDIGSEMPQGNLSKLMALQLHIRTDRFYTRLPDFIRICNVLSGATTPDPDDPADVDEMLWGMTEAMLVEPPDTAEPFSLEIRRYIGEKLKDEGFLEPPDLLRIGVRTDNWRGVLASYADRPELQQKIKAAADEKTAAMMRMVKARLRDLAAELQTVKLLHGDMTNLLERLSQTLAHNLTNT